MIYYYYKKKNMYRNPFEIKTPEQNTAEEIVKLFVDVFTDFHQVPEAGHTFVNGPRGSGKSMMFRYIQPDCQCIVSNCKINELKYFSIYIPIKLTSINIVDFERLKSHANTILNEHIFVTYILSKSLLFISETLGEEVLNNSTDEIKNFYDKIFVNLVLSAGYTENTEIESDTNGFDCFRIMSETIYKMHRECVKYCKELALNKEINSYNGSLVDFMDFLYPFFQKLKKLSIFPLNKPLYLLIDDAGYLNNEQTKILNTWVSYRTTKDLCIKISTQLDYKTYLTTNGKRIDSPHDYSEINIATIYTSSNKDYFKKIKQIVERRLKVYLNTDILAEDFFPHDPKQEDRINKIYEEIKIKESDEERKHAGTDAARRYCVSEYLKELRSKKAMNKYSFSGFDQLVAISSGVIRHFLAPAQEMYSETVSRNNNNKVEYISPAIQNEIISSYSRKFLFDEFDKIFIDSKDDDNRLKNADKLYNLIDSLGKLFHLILISERKERTVFSVALTDMPDRELKEIIDMGVQHGYFHVSTKRNKESTGLVHLYVLSRVLAPAFVLNPLSFAGYQFMPSEVLKIALTNPTSFIKYFDKKLDSNSEKQPTLFD
ncbi:MAG: hypothetical protein PHE33_04055 [Bacteroidales bacterium]|nr:hypothetical protein [Bacteroidales bacterium]